MDIHMDTCTPFMMLLILTRSFSLDQFYHYLHMGNVNQRTCDEALSHLSLVMSMDGSFSSIWIVTLGKGRIIKCRTHAVWPFIMLKSVKLVNWFSSDFHCWIVCVCVCVREREREREREEEKKGDGNAFAFCALTVVPFGLWVDWDLVRRTWVEFTFSCDFPAGCVLCVCVCVSLSLSLLHFYLLAVTRMDMRHCSMNSVSLNVTDCVSTCPYCALGALISDSGSERSNV